ncbi:MAG: amidohydrolase [Candidatus Marinimicrobia bacterium]|nr:amidohydrolase [Candidatus Neomarinimicrobiota bacterium]
MRKRGIWYLLILFIPGLIIGKDPIDKAISKNLNTIIDLRHQIHQYPELGNREYKTAKLVAKHLRSLGIEVETDIAYTGVVGVLKGNKPGPVVAVRADMDALPVTEETDLSFKSTVKTTYLDKEVGVMHACGHDIHTSVQLGVASVLASMKRSLPGTVKFIFQPAEEGPPPGEEGGADLMLKEGVFANLKPSAIFGLHTHPGLAVGELGLTIGPAMAAVDHFIITIKGKQSHGAYPHKSVDPIIMATEAVGAFQTIRSRSLSPLEPSVVTVGIIRGGERFNIIPEQVHLEGTVRTYNPEVQDMVEHRMNKILEGITLAYGGSFELDYDRGTPATINDPELAKQMIPTMERVVGKNNLKFLDPVMGGEDFAFFANEVPGMYYRLGVLKPGTTSGWVHTPTFRADDSCLEVGIRAMSNLVVDFLKSNGK